MIGIYLMGFAILVAGVGVFGTAIAYAIRPTERTLVLMVEAATVNATGDA